MSRFLSRKFAALTPYVPGEQPKQTQLLKLNTNESPFAPSPKTIAAAAQAAEKLNLYSDPDCTLLCEAAAKHYGVRPENLLPVNGSDEILYLAFLTFCDDGVAYPSISYGFYPVCAAVCGVSAQEIPLDDALRINPADYSNLGKTIVLANPNAPTGSLLTTAQIESILQANANQVVLIDEAYIDFGGESCVPLIAKYDNLLVTQTFSKSRSMAGARLGFGIASAALIADLRAVKDSINPYNINRMTQAAGIAACEDNAFYLENCRKIISTREKTAQALETRGFRVLPSAANFLFVSPPDGNGGQLYRRLRERGVLVRHFDKPDLTAFLRVTIGTDAQMERLLREIDTIYQEERP